MCGPLGRAAEYLGRSARLIEHSDEDAASERYVYASAIMVPEGSDSTTNFVRVVGASDVLVQGIRFLASTDRLEECMGVRLVLVWCWCGVGVV